MPNTEIRTEPAVVGWLVYSFSDERNYAGNKGYKENPLREYRFDSFVQNAKQMRPGHILVMADRSRLIGFGRVSKIIEGQKIKELLRCPYCRTTAIRFRMSLRPRGVCDRCSKKFDKATIDRRPCKSFVAKFDGSFLRTRESTSTAELRRATDQPKAPLAMRRIDLARLVKMLGGRAPELSRLLGNTRAPLLPPESAAEKPYRPGKSDSRIAIKRQIKQRRGQRAFRDGLRRLYGDRCMISGCRLMDIVEAAHISPYRGQRDNNLQNGLLLRSDLHTLFDLELLGIEPKRLSVHLAPSVMLDGYEKFKGARLRCNARTHPSKAALRMRWKRFAGQP